MERTARILEWRHEWTMSGYHCCICNQSTRQEACIEITDNVKNKKYVSSFVCIDCAESPEEALMICEGRKI